MEDFLNLLQKSFPNLSAISKRLRGFRTGNGHLLLTINPANMKSNLTGLLLALLLPTIIFGQTFKAPEFSHHTDIALLAKQIEKHSPLVKNLLASTNIRTDMSPQEARAIINQKLNELNNEDLKKVYARLDNEQATRVGIILYLMMNGLSNTGDYPQDFKMGFGGGLGVYLMWTLANFVLMPEFAYMMRSFKSESVGNTYRDRYSFLSLAFTAMYVLRMTTINLLFGLSPNLSYLLSGSSKAGDQDWEDIDLDNQGVEKAQIGLGITAGVMLQNAIIIRLMYNLGLSKLRDNNDFKMYAIALALHVPFWTLRSN